MITNKKEMLKQLNAKSKDTLAETLDMEFCDIGENFLTIKMPASPKVHQPDGVLHGGASVALAETVGSVASFIFTDQQEVFVRGIEINANHIRSISEGYVYARAGFIHKGRTTQVWDIKISNEEGKLISAVKLTTLTLPKQVKN